MPHFTRDPVVISVVESTQSGEARRAAVALASGLGFDEEQTGQVAIVVTEAATNLVRHAKSGEIILRSVHCPDGPALEMLAIDRGPGMSNLGESMRDGHSSGNTPGNGMGAMTRGARTFDVFTHPPGGTVLLARFGPESLTQQCPPHGVVCLPKKGEAACGDAWTLEQSGEMSRVLVADGLGHGLQAAEASQLAVRLFRDNLDRPPAAIVAALHAGLRSTRGAAVAVAELRPSDKQIRFAGIGNVSAGTIVGGRSRSMMSHNGTVGVEARRIQEITYPWSPEELVFFHTDGLSAQWQLDHYPGLRFKHPAVVAGTLYRDLRRERDDVTVLIINSAYKAER